VRERESDAEKVAEQSPKSEKKNCRRDQKKSRKTKNTQKVVGKKQEPQKKKHQKGSRSKDPVAFPRKKYAAHHAMKNWKK